MIQTDPTKGGDQDIKTDEKVCCSKSISMCHDDTTKLKGLILILDQIRTITSSTDELVWVGLFESCITSS